MNTIINHLTTPLYMSTDGSILNWHVYAIGAILICLVATVITINRKTSNV